MGDIIRYAPGDETIAAIAEAQRVILTQQTPKSAILHRKGKGGVTFSYVPHAWVTEQLNQAFGWAWSWEIVEWRVMPEADPQEVFVVGRLTVHAPNGNLVKQQFGSSDVKRNRTGDILSIGDDLKAASSDALKKAASLLGIALDLYKSDVPPSDDDSRSSNLSDDPMTAYWAAVKAKGLDGKAGQQLLSQANGDANKALKMLATNTPAPTSATKKADDGNGSKPQKPQKPISPQDLLQRVDAAIENTYNSLPDLLVAIQAKLGEKWSWPGPNDLDGWRAAKAAAIEYAEGNK